MRNGPVLALLAAALLFGCGGGDSTSTSGISEVVQYFHLGSVRGDVPTVVTFQLLKPFHPEATVELAEAPVGAFAPENLPMNAPSGQYAPLWVTFTPEATSALQEGTIRLLFRRVTGGEAHPVTLRLDAQVEVPSARLLQAQVPAGKAAVGETVRFDVMIENTSKATPIMVTEVTLEDGEFSLAPDAFPLPMPVGAGSRFFVPLLYKPQGEWSASSVIRIHHSAAAVPFEATVTGTGIAPLVIHDYGFVPLDPFTFESEWLTLEVPEEGVGIFLEAWGDPAASLVDLIGLEGPSGTIYEDQALAGPLGWLDNYPAGARGYLNVELPNSDLPAVQLEPGGGIYRFRLRDSAFAAGGLQVRVMVSQRRRGTVREGTLDLMVFLSDGLPIANRSDPMSDTKLAWVMKTIDAMFGMSGVRLGTVSFSFLDPSKDILDDAAETESMIAGYTDGLGEGPLNLFLVKDIAYGINGIAGAMPGPLANGTPFSGVVIDYGSGNGIVVGATAAHEMSHYLGHGHSDDGVESVMLAPDEVFAVLRHPLLGAGLPEVLVSPPESTSYGSLLSMIELMPPIIDWCGTCGRMPLR